MKITDLEIFHYRLPLRHNIIIKKHSISKREGIILKLTDDQGHNGFGEIAPLPGLNRESLEEAILQIKEIRPHMTTLEISSLDQLSVIKKNLYACAQCGLEIAVLNLLSNSSGKTIAELLGLTSTRQIPINALLQGKIETIVEQTVDLINAGFRTFKLKVGSAHIAEDLEKITALKDILHNQGTLRLDANQAWSLSQAIDFAAQLDRGIVEYIEEPVSDPAKLPEFFQRTRIQFALDESLNYTDAWKTLPGVGAVILKPMALGGVIKTLAYMHLAQKKGISAVISSSFESGVGISALSHLAAHHPSTAAGLDTLKYFSHDLLKEPLAIQNGQIKLRSPIKNLNELNAEFLTPILI